MSKGSPEKRMAAALGGRGFSGGAQQAPKPARTVVNFPGIRAGEVHIGDAELGGAIGLDLVKLLEGRLLIQGASGAGKSWALRRLLEETAGQVQQIVIDPEGEFRHYAEKFGLLHLEGRRLDIDTLDLAATRAREHRASLVLDLSELDRDDQMMRVTAFLTALISAHRDHWHPTLIAIDEAHIFAPFGGYTESTHVRKASIAAVTDLMSRGRKRGLAGVIATQRLARLAKSVVSEALNFMVGLNTLDLDIRRAAETIGWDAKKGFDRLPMLSPGDFVVVGPAFSQSPTVLKVGPTRTLHIGAAPKLRAPENLAPDAAARLIDLEALLQASAADQASLQENAAAPGLRIVRAFIREEAFPDTGRVFGALRKLAPDGAIVADLTRHLNRPAADIAAAIALLDLYGVLEFSGEDKERAVRITKGVLP